MFKHTIVILWNHYNSWWLYSPSSMILHPQSIIKQTYLLIYAQQVVKKNDNPWKLTAMIFNDSTCSNHESWWHRVMKHTAVVFIRFVLTVDVAITHPVPADTAAVLTGKFMSTTQLLHPWNQNTSRASIHYATILL